MAAPGRGFTKVPNALLSDTGLDVHCRMLAALLLMHAGQAASCFPSEKTLARYLNLKGDRAVRSHLRHLEGAGLKVAREAFKGKSRNRYYVERLDNYVAPNRHVDAAPTGAQMPVPTGTQVPPNQTQGKIQNEPDAAPTSECGSKNSLVSDGIEHRGEATARSECRADSSAPRQTPLEPASGYRFAVATASEFYQRHGLGIAPADADLAWVERTISDPGYGAVWHEAPSASLMLRWRGNVPEAIVATERLLVRLWDAQRHGRECPIDKPAPYVAKIVKKGDLPSDNDRALAALLKRERQVAYWIERMDEQGVCCNLEEVPADLRAEVAGAVVF